jgi:arginyl-tRNA synthetase
VFRESDGAVIFPGEGHGLHNRVFLNSEGLPTYEAKDIGLAKLKYKTYPADMSIVITANEQSEYFKVVIEALRHIAPEIAKRMTHIGHGMMRVPSGKMSSRKGNIVTGESILENTIEMAREKIVLEDANEQEKNLIAQSVGVGAIKFAILRHVIGKDIVYDENKSLSFEGDSGPYVQYTIARSKSILRNAAGLGIKADTKTNTSGVTDVERLLHRFPAVVESATDEYMPHLVCTYLLELASAFNSYYAKYPVLGGGDEAPYRVALTKAVSQVLSNGLYLLGITAPERM